MADRATGKGDLEGTSSGGKEDLETPALVKRASKEMKYVSLHHHSTFSYVDGYALPKSHVHRAAEIGMPALALTEHGNVSSHVKLEQAGRDYGIDTIFGVELYTGSVGDDRTQRKNHLTVLAGTQAGYQSLLNVVSQGWSDFYYEPTVSGAALEEHKEGLIILSGCTGSLLATSLIGGKNVPVEEASYQRAKNVARRFKRTFGDAYYLEVQMFPELENVRRINEAYERMSRELGIPLVATGDCHYTRPEESELQQILHSIGRNKSMEQLAQDWGYDVPLSPPLNDEEVYKRLRGTGLSHRATLEAVASTLEIAGRCKGVEIPHMEAVRFPLPEGYSTKEEVWRAWLREGWDFRKIDSRPDTSRYVEQVKKEMAVIESKDFLDYFLFTSDLVKWAKGRGIAVGPARGSAAASLVCYLLRITEVDPLRFDNLLFERFIDYTRDDLPDIDLDFDDERRYEVFEYAANKYGRENVGRIGSYTKFKAKNSLDDVGAVFGIPPWEISQVKEVLVERSSGDLRSSATIEDTVEQFDQAADVFEAHPELWNATRLEGNYKAMGVHSAGLVVASAPIRSVCAVYVRTDPKTGEILEDEYGNPREVVSFDKYDAETHNLLKMDILGLTNMGLIRIACEFIGMDLLDLYDIELTDEETMRGFAENDVTGIFQFDGWATRQVNEAVKPAKFSEIADVNALSRPGPLRSDAHLDYVAVKTGASEPEVRHPLFDPIVSATHGQIIYQEQILRIVREIGNFEWTHAAYIRKIISRKIGEQEFNRQGDKFREGARANGIDDAITERIWATCISSGSYAFNAAHSVSYALLGFWTMWLKRHHPQAFYAAAIHKLGKNKDKYLPLLRDAEQHGVRILGPSPKLSNVTWTPTPKGNVRAGFAQLPGLGPKKAIEIVRYREKHEIKEWKDMAPISGIGPKTIENAEAFSQTEDPFNIYTLEKQIAKVTEEIREGKLGNLPVPTHTAKEIPTERGHEEEIVWLGHIHARNLRDIFEINQARGKDLDQNTFRRPDLNEWVVMQGADHTDRVSVSTERFTYPRWRKAVWSIDLDKDLVLVHGIKRSYSASRAIRVLRLWVLTPE